MIRNYSPLPSTVTLLLILSDSLSPMWRNTSQLSKERRFFYGRCNDALPLEICLECQIVLQLNPVSKLFLNIIITSGLKSLASQDCNYRKWWQYFSILRWETPIWEITEGVGRWVCFVIKQYTVYDVLTHDECVITALRSP